MRFTPFLILSAILSFSSAYVFNSNAAASDRITSLPGLSQTFNFETYSGYLTVDAKNNRQIFYWFVAAQNNPTTAPLVWWSNGGPGCSGLIGFFEEMGPFRVVANGTVVLNTEYAWNNKANMLFVEAPAGVGFSKSDVASDYVVGDDRTASDNYLAILQFLTKFPELVPNPFYVASESYGGHYGPQLVQAIQAGNAALNTPQVNLKGAFIGNPLTNTDENLFYGMIPTFIGHALVPKNVADSYKECMKSIIHLDCDVYELAVIAAAGNLDPYALDFPVCLNTESEHKLSKMQADRMLFALSQTPGWGSAATRKYIQEKFQAREEAKNRLGLPYDPCTENYVTAYLDRTDVRNAIHVTTTNKWEACTNSITYSVVDHARRMQTVWADLIAQKKLRLTIFSGDDDTVCATLGSMHWIWNLGLNVVKSWHSWTDSASGQVGGYLTQFDGFSFATVHTAGHTVPSFQPARGLQLFSDFLDGKLNNI